MPACLRGLLNRILTCILPVFTVEISLAGCKHLSDLYHVKGLFELCPPQVVDLLERNNYYDMHRYTATDADEAAGAAVKQAVTNPKLSFQVLRCRLASR